MRYLLIGMAALTGVAICAACRAWDGFDADSTDLVEIIPDKVPSPGDAVDVRGYDSEDSHPCLVESVRRNRRTIEVVVREADGKRRTLVMESR